MNVWPTRLDSPRLCYQSRELSEVAGHWFPNCSANRSISYSKASSKPSQHLPKSRYSRDSYILSLITEELIRDTLRPKDKIWVILDQGLRFCWCIWEEGIFATSLSVTKCHEQFVSLINEREQTGWEHVDLGVRGTSIQSSAQPHTSYVTLSKSLILSGLQCFHLQNGMITSTSYHVCED